MSAHTKAKRKHTAKELAKRWAVSERTVRAYVAQLRADFEAQSLTRSKPWEALQVSRATWYRRKKSLMVG